MANREDILNELREITPIADRFPAEIPYRLPAEYFDRLPDNLLRRIKAEQVSSVTDELLILSPLLGKLDKKMPFTVPENYFDDLLPAGIKETPVPKTAKIIQGSFATRIFRLSVAAAIAGIVAFGTWFLVKPAATSEPALTIAQNALNNTQNISDSEMNAYLDGSSMASIYENTPLSSEEIQPEDVKVMLADITDDELQHYAEQDNTATPIFN